MPPVAGRRISRRPSSRGTPESGLGTFRGCCGVVQAVDRPDEDLARAAQRGDPDAVSALFARHWPAACRTARLLGGDAAAAEDVAQEAMVRAFGRLHRFDASRRFAPWLRRVVINTAINHRRRSARLVALGDDTPDPAGTAESAGVLKLVDGLPEDRRVVVLLRFGLELTPSEIAEALGVPVGTVNSRLNRAMADLRIRLEVPR